MFLIFKVVKIDLHPSLSLLLTLINYRVCVWLHVRQALSSSSIKLSYVGLDWLDTPIVSTISIYTSSKFEIVELDSKWFSLTSMNSVIKKNQKDGIQSKLAYMEIPNRKQCFIPSVCTLDWFVVCHWVKGPKHVYLL